MEINKNFYDLDFDSIPINDFWNTGSEIEQKMHRIHAYPAKFPAFITTKALNYAESEGIEVKTVADIFCGCGTTAFEASRNGKDFWGCDINPVATLIAEAKSHKYNENKLNEYFNNIEIRFNALIVKKDSIKNVNNRIKYWFEDYQICDLLKLKNSIYDCLPINSYYMKFFLCAFSNILKPTSKWLQKSIKPQIDPNKRIANVWKTFSSQIEMMKKANNESDIKRNTNIKIETANFLTKRINIPKVDLLVTSPPYVTSYEYADLHQLSTLWLDFTEDYRSYREGTIGSLYHDTNYNNDVDTLNSSGKNIVLQLFEVDKRKATSVAKYFVDMQNSIEKAYKLLNSGGYALFVMGNTEYKGIRIDNAKQIVESMLKVGFININVDRRKISKKILTPYRDKQGKFTADKNARKVYSEEFIIIAKKAKQYENI
jgi:methylase of polypeptide subunit release factors